MTEGEASAAETDAGLPDADLPEEEARAAGPAQDPLELAALAILGYLDDLAGCRELCQRHQDDAGFRPDPHGLFLVAAAERTGEGELAHVRTAVEALPSAGPWRGQAAGEDAAIVRHLLWEEEPLHVRIIPGEFGLLRAELALPHRPEVPRLPLRATASLLRCLEYILPPLVARPLPLAELDDGTLVGLWDFLRRITPENLPSSQCIWPGDEVQPSVAVNPFPPQP